MRRILKYITRIFLALVAMVVLYFLTGSVLSFVGTRPDAVNCKEDRTIYISSNGIHLDFILPASLVERRTLEALGVPEEAKFVSFGWGDKGFYLQTPTWNELKFDVAMKALFLKSESAMHVDYHMSYSGYWTPLKVCPRQLDSIKVHIMESFSRSNKGEIIRIQAAGYRRTDAFYSAEGNYTMINTCNEWVNQGLKKAKVKTAVWSPFEFGVLYHVQE